MRIDARFAVWKGKTASSTSIVSLIRIGGFVAE